MSTRPRHGRRPAALGLALSLFLLPGFLGSLNADVVLMEDGRRFEGKVLEETSSFVRIDTMVGDVRANLRLYRFEVKSVVKKPVPAGFFDSKTKADAREPDAELGGLSYIEVPIVGRFGAQVVPKGVARCLAYAARHKIEHVVFQVDSHGGDATVASEIYNLLAEYDDRLTYHAVVRDALGLAMVVPVYCDNVFMQAGATMGGVQLSLDQFDDPDVTLSQVAYEVGQVAEEHGWHPKLVQAMIDPEIQGVVWLTSDGKLASGASAPPGARIILQSGRDSVVTINRAQAVALGQAKGLDGGAERVGGRLGLEDWQLESGYGDKTMAAEARTYGKRLERKEERHAKKVKKNLHKRELAKKYIERSLDKANEWDDELTTYASYKGDSERWDDFWGGWGGRQEQTIKKSTWQQLTDKIVYALEHARRGVQQMKRLDRDAVALGLEPTYEPGRLDEIHHDLEVKIRLLLSQRNKPSRERK